MNAYRHISCLKVAVAAAAAALLSTSCFKKESYDTLFRIAVYNQNVSGEPLTRATDLESYAFYVDTAMWRIASWEDALAHVITDKSNPSVKLSVPDAVGIFDAGADFQVTLPLTAPMSMLVVVDKANSTYAYRKYESPINLPEIFAQLHMYAWRRTYNANGWRIVNPQPDTERPPLVPTEPDLPQTPDEPGKYETPDTPDQPETPEMPDEPEAPAGI